jgi:hypothetical protein
MTTMQTARKTLKYLKTKDIEDFEQLRKELNTVIKQEFTNNSELSNGTGINTMQSNDSEILKFNHKQ